MSLEKFISECDKITKKIEFLRESQNTKIVVDGVIDPQRYYKAYPKIMWILKEANSEESWSYLDKFKDREWLGRCNGISSIRRVIYTSYGILKGEKMQWSEYPWSQDEKCLDALQSISFINIKKNPGENVSYDEEIHKAYSHYRGILKMQVNLYDPEIIIFGNTLKYVDLDDFVGLGKAEKQISAFGNHYYHTGNKLYIHAWHPACRGEGFTDEGYVMDIVNICQNWKGLK